MSAKPIPEGYHTVTPFIIVKGGPPLLDFMEDAFGRVEIARVAGQDGAIGHAETRVGDSVVMMVDAKQDWPDTREAWQGLDHSAALALLAGRCMGSAGVRLGIQRSRGSTVHDFRARST